MSFKRLNAFSWSNMTIRDAIEYLKNKTIPDYLESESSIYRFKRKMEGFTISEDGKSLYWGPLKVIPKGDIQKTLKKMYDEDTTGLFIGRDKLYAKVKEKYIGISKEAVEMFLNNLESNQLNKPIYKKKVVRPITTKGNNERWQMDLIVLKSLKSENDGNKYILTIIDLFSKFAWAVPLKSKKQDKVADALEDIILTSGRKPKILQSDNGPEFKGTFFDDLSERCGFKQVHSLPYTPQSNGAIERFNGILKKSIKAYFTKTGKRRWIDILNSLVYNYNNSKHSTTDENPIDIVEADENDDVEILSQVRDKIKNRSERVLRSDDAKLPEIKIGSLLEYLN